MSTRHPGRTAIDADLQRFHDEEGSTEERAAFAARLLQDPALRNQLDALRRLDDLARRAARADARHARRPRRGVLAAAACVTLVAAIWAIAPPPGATTSRQPNPAPSGGARVVLAIPAVARPISPTPAPAQTRGDLAGATAEARVAADLAAGRIEDAVTVLSRLPVAEHGDLWARLAQHMRSAETARASIMLLPVDQQVEIVRVWANTPSLRPVVFERLEELLRDPDAADAARALRDDLARAPAMRSWVSSYAAR
ncbi:MAG: hypothetical protein D6693_05145 [Planctomycetota bacterium]|nr:MAG: hypothetical protein D6693_05145 [Planctomycetota bacterium]